MTKLDELREVFEGEGISIWKYTGFPASDGVICTNLVRELLAEAQRNAGFAEACRQLTLDSSKQRERIAELEAELPALRRVKVAQLDANAAVIGMVNAGHAAQQRLAAADDAAREDNARLTERIAELEAENAKLRESNHDLVCENARLIGQLPPARRLQNPQWCEECAGPCSVAVSSWSTKDPVKP